MCCASTLWVFDKKVMITGFGCSNSCCCKENSYLFPESMWVRCYRLHTDKGLQYCYEKLLMVTVGLQVYDKCQLWREFWTHIWVLLNLPGLSFRILEAVNLLHSM